MLELAPARAQSYIVLSSCLTALTRTSEAIGVARRAVELAPRDASTHGVLGDALCSELRYKEAQASCLTALSLDPYQEKARTNLGKILLDRGDAEGAVAAAKAAVSLAPKALIAHNNLLFSLNYSPSASAEEVFEAYRQFNQVHCEGLRSTWRPHANPRDARRRIRVGYVSPDFRQHSGNNFIEPLLSNHDRENLELHAYAEFVAEDPVTTRFKTYFDAWTPTAGMSDAALADRIRADGIDILIDVAGHTGGNRLGVFARKPAPISLTWLGFGYTTGLTAIDYIMSDEVMAPTGSEALFSEKPWRLPDSNFVYRAGAGMGDCNDLPAKKNGFITFGSLTRAIRMNDKVVGVWAEILRRVPQSRLIVNSRSYKDGPMREELASRFGAHGIARDRLLIGWDSPPWDILRSMDIGLDCFPHNSGVTLVETLYMGVPYITLASRPSVGRIGSSILHGIQRPEWVAQSEVEYVEKVVALASDLPALASIRAGLRDEMQASPLMDEPAFARKFEGALREMFKNWCETQA
jgi:predicted O-linked N-acetylglucosamine transferase (SPINDLY family)